MGGAYIAVSDDLASITFNPATIEIFQTPKDFRLTFYANPLATFASLKTDGLLPAGRKKADWSEVLRSLGLMVKAIGFSVKYIEGGIIFSEESLQNAALNTRKQFFSAANYDARESHTLGLRLKLAAQVGIGVNTTCYHVRQDAQNWWKFGTSYGVLLRPNKHVSAGVFYLALPSEANTERQPLERLVNDTVNIGVAYQPAPATTLALDVRNITQDNELYSRELHLGGEHCFGRWLTLRSGFFQPDRKSRCYSAGLGILSENLFVKPANQLYTERYLFNYTFVLEQRNHTNTSWHLFAFTLRF